VPVAEGGVWIAEEVKVDIGIADNRAGA